MPRYVDFGGEIVYPLPYNADGVQFYGFVLKGDAAKIQTNVCDKLFNNAIGSQRFTTISNDVLLVYNSIDSLYSRHQPYKDRGHFNEMECAIWIPVRDNVTQRLFWAFPYIFVDNPYAMAMGREVYGFPKSLGWFDIPAQAADADYLGLETILVPEFGPEAVGSRAPLIETYATQQVEASELSADAMGKTSALCSELRGLLTKLVDLGELAIHELEDLLALRVPMVFLKQFRDIANPTEACFQAVQECACQLSALNGGGLLPGNHEVTIHPADSHPIASDLGLPTGAIQPELSFWVNFDFLVNGGQEIWRADTTPKKKKIAILGGGTGSLTSAFNLTNEAGWQDKYDITVHQLGWRLGGKGASGRGIHNRIEEHGLHIWMGFYDHAFNMIQQAYAEMNRPAGAPLRNWDDAFKKHDYIVIAEQVRGEWKDWVFNFPENDEVPGDPDDNASLWDYVEEIVEYVLKKFKPLGQSITEQQNKEEGLVGHILNALRPDHILEELLKSFEDGLDTLETVVRDGVKAASDKVVLHALENVRDWLHNEITELGNLADDIRRDAILLDLAVTCGIGMLKDGVWWRPQGLTYLDQWDFHEWLRKHNAWEETVDCAVVRGLYELVFGYEGGLINQPNFAAGVALRSALNIALRYKGAIFWEMQAGMGDVVFSPLYQVLKDRGVKFEFFHEVQNLGLSPDKQRIDTITIGQQATFKDPDAGYLPLFDVNGLPCWPAKPDYDQLVEGQQLQDENVDLESFWSTWQNPETLTLKLDEDFDEVILGIPVASLPYICPELIAADPKWQSMTEEVKTVRTLAMQLWLNKDLAELGRPNTPAPVMDAYEQRFNTWADLSYLSEREDYPPGMVKNIAYFCGPMAGGIPPQSDSDTKTRAQQAVREQAELWLETNTNYLWPDGVQTNNPNALDYNLLVDTDNGEGTERLDAQYFRANVDPTERYTLSVKNSTQYRLKAGESGFENLYLCGDWIDNGFNAGCIEASVWSGEQAAEAVAET